MAVELVTGYVGKPHITSQQDAVLNAATLGTSGKYILEVGNSFSYELKSNTLIRISDGYAINQGRLMGMPNHEYQDLTIQTGTAGAKRSDLVVLHYVKNSITGIESAELKIITGTAGAQYVDPECADNDLLNQDNLLDDMILYRIKLNGINVESVERVAPMWYLDTGKREDIINVENVKYMNSSPTSSEENFYMRLIGNQIRLGGRRRCEISKDSANPSKIKFDKALAPSYDFSWTESLVYQSTTNIIHYTVSKDGYVSVWVQGNYPIWMIGLYNINPWFND
jgi:hypothetical protein